MRKMQVIYTKEMNDLIAAVPEKYWSCPEEAPEQYRKKIEQFNKLFEERYKEAHRVLLGIEF